MRGVDQAVEPGSRAGSPSANVDAKNRPLPQDAHCGTAVGRKQHRLLDEFESTVYIRFKVLTHLLEIVATFGVVECSIPV